VRREQGDFGEVESASRARGFAVKSRQAVFDKHAQRILPLATGHGIGALALGEFFWIKTGLTLLTTEAAHGVLIGSYQNATGP
jgi:hypothetical protein